MQVMGHSMHRCLDQIAGATSFFHRLGVAVTEVFQDSRFAIHARGKIRRIWLAHFRKGYVQRQASARQGDCRQCGVCCNLLFSCPMLTKDSLCLVYNTYRAQVCKTFPIDQRDIHEVELYGGHCGYSFKKQDSDF